MARPLRIQAAGLTYHITARGNAKMPIFVDAIERRTFLRLLARACGRRGVECHAYCLMTNHYHLVIKTLRPNLSLTMQRLNSAYAEWWNKRRQRVGHVFQGRFGSQVVQDGDYFLTVCRYVVRNAVAADMVTSLEAWPWSSYRATAGLSRVPAFLKPDVLLRLFGAKDRRTAMRRYRAFVCAPDAGADSLPEGPVVGDDAFVDQFNEWF